MRSYEEDAIRSARENGFVQNEGIAGELAARFYLKRGLGQSGRCLSPGRAFLLPALGRAWQGKAARSTLPAAGRAGSSTCTIGTPVQQLDLVTVIKASQAVSGEIVL